MRKHETWVRTNQVGEVDAKTRLSKGNAEIKSNRLFKAILEQAKKDEEEFRRKLHG